MNMNFGNLAWNIARVLAASMLVYGFFGTVSSLNLIASPKGDLPVNWPAFAFSLVVALAGSALVVVANALALGSRSQAEELAEVQ